MSRLEVWLECVPLANPVQLASRAVSERHWLLVRVTTKDGVSGLGFAYAGYEAGEIALAAVEHLLGPLILGQDAAKTDRVWATLYRQAMIQGRAGAVQRALSAIDIALYDRNARAAGLPLADYIGRGRELEPDTYFGAGYYEAGGDPAEARTLAKLVAAGARAVKVKVGRFGPDRESQRLRAFRQTVGDDVHLTVDANGAFASVPDAVAAIEAYRRHSRIDMIEDPFSPDDIDAYCELCLHGTVPVATGELFTNEAEFGRFMRTKAVHVPQIDVTACGGITAFRRIVAIAAAHGLMVETHWFPELHRQLAMTTPQVRRIEVFQDDEIINFGKLVMPDPGGKAGHGLVSTLSRPPDTVLGDG